MTKVTGTPSFLAEVADQATLRQLEFSKALEVVASRAVSDIGAERVRSRRPNGAADSVREDLLLVQEYKDLLEEKEPLLPEAVPDIRSILEEIAVVGSVADGAELNRTADVLSAIQRVAAGLAKVSAADAPRVARLLVEVPPRELGEKISRSIEPDGSVKDGASVALKKARRQVRSVRDQIVNLLQDIIRKKGSSVSTQDSGVTLRNGRYVIPVRKEAGSKVKGIVHGESGSGHTRFVEPEEAVSLGNQLNAAEAEEEREVLRVLRDLTDLVRPHVPEIFEGWEMCIRLDDAYARARYSLDVDSHLPEMLEAPANMKIVAGRHPVLLADLDSVVPFDLALEHGEYICVVSGPNTGGKTVLLKGVGLLCAMAQSGIIPPVGEGTLLPVFRHIFADIGDNQSLAENLSTFSAHLVALKNIVERADRDTLVLVDEFGTGTDPTEGAALAGAVLVSLAEKCTPTIATTHLSHLKQLASETEGAINASLQFDPDKLAPTYKVIKGVPGRSYGLAIAKRLGFPSDLMEKAEQLQPEAERSFDRVLADLEKREHEVNTLADELHGLKAQMAAERDGLDALKSRLDEQHKSLQEEQLRLEKEGRMEARRFLLDARKRVEEALGTARAAVTEATAKEARRLVEEGVQDEKKALEGLEEQLAKKGWRIAGSKPGVRKEKQSKKSEQELLRQVKRRPKPQADAQVQMVEASTEINLRGMLADDAEQALLRGLDDATVADIRSIRIIHGKGTGALRARVQQVLKRDKRVKDFATPPPHEGGYGVTVAELIQ